MKIEEAYDLWSQNYDNDVNRTRDLDQQVIQKILPLLNGKDIIDAGCGTGKNTEWFAAKAKSVVAFDFSKKMLELARQRVKNVPFLKHDITQTWPVDESSADIISINLVLEHIRDLNYVFSEAYRVLRSNGILAACELHPEQQLKGTKARFTNGGKKTIKIKSFYHSKNDYLIAGQKAGFKKIHFENWYDENAKNELPRLISILMTRNQ